MAISTFDSKVLPGPSPMPLIGRRGNEIRFYGDMLGYMLMLYGHHGTIAGLVKEDPRWVFAFGPDNTRAVLSNADLFQSRILTIPAPANSALRRITTGLLGMNGAQHRQQRRLIAPAFHKKQVARYRDDIVALTTQTLDVWKSGDHVDIAREMQLLTMRIVSKVLFGLETGDETNGLGVTIRRWLGMFASAPVNLFPVDLPGTPYYRLLKLSEQLEQGIIEMIKRKRENLADQYDVLAVLLHAHDEDGAMMSDVELVGQANLLFIAGHETVSSALTWTLFLLTQHPTVLGDLLDELEHTTRDGAPTTEQLEQLPLLDAVVKESLRLLPPAPYLERVSAAPFQLGPYTFPEGTYVSLSNYIIHHLPDLYTDPNQFRPHRWNDINPSPYEYLPFGAGPHSCIGAALATMEIKLILSLVIQRFKLTTPANTRVDRQLRVTLSPKQGMPMQLAAQDRKFVRSSVRGNIHEMVDLVK